MGKVKLSDGRIADAFDTYAGKMRQVSIDGELKYWPRELMEAVESEGQLTMTKVPAIDRLEEVLRYKRVVEDEDPGNGDYMALIHDLKAEVREELRTIWGV